MSTAESALAGDQSLELLSIEAVALALGVSVPTVYRLIRSGQLAGVKPGRKTQVTSAALRRYLQRLDAAAEAEAEAARAETESPRPAEDLS